MWRWVAALALAAPLVLLLAEVARFGVNTMFTDEIYYVPFIRLVLEGGDWHPWIWLQHNEHRVIPMKLLMVALAGPTHWSQKAEMWATVVIILVVVGLVWAIYRRSGGERTVAGALVFAPVVWLVATLGQYENLLTGMQVCFLFTSLGTVAALYLLGWRSWIATLGACIAAVLGAFSIISGFMVFPAGVAVLLSRRATWPHWFLWLGSGAVAVDVYQRSYIRPPHTVVIQYTLGGLYKVVKLWLATLGAPLAAGSEAWAVAAGLLLTGVTLFFAWRWWKSDADSREEQGISFGLVLFAMGFAASIAVGRAFMAGIDPIGSRYITHSLLGWVGAYFLTLHLVRREGRPAWAVAACALLLPALLAADLFGLKMSREWRLQRVQDQYVMQTIDHQSDRVVARFGPPASFREQISYLKQARLSGFAVAQRMLLLMDPTTGLPTQEIVPGAAAEQTLVCPIPVLHDVGVLMLPADLPGKERFEIVVSSGSQQLVRHVATTAEAGAWSWLRVDLPRPFADCAGKPLKVRLASVDGGPGKAVRVLAAEPYFPGSDLTVGSTAMPGRRLGMALDAYHLGVL